MTDSLGQWPIHDTVKPYHRHFFVCTGRTEWPARIEEADSLAGRMARQVRALREAGMDPAPKLTWTDAVSHGPGLDVLVFPESIRYREVGEGEWQAILMDHAGGGRITPRVRSDPQPGVHVFVCVNGARDERCGRCGPPVLAAFREAIAARGLSGVHAHATSHVGGHKYAGNVLIYPDGVWYGYVGTADVSRILADHILHGRIVDDLYRGCMGNEPLVSSRPGGAGAR